MRASPLQLARQAGLGFIIVTGSRNRRHYDKPTIRQMATPPDAWDISIRRVQCQRTNQTCEQAAAQHLPHMATDAHPAFEVATIKPSSPSEVGGNIRLGGHEVRLDNQSVVDLIAFAYSLHKKQIIGLPNWLNEAHFDIQGESNIIAIPNLTQVQEMLQKLLVERFGLVFHFGERELPVFAITVDKSGAKLHASDSHSTLPSETGLPSEAGTRSRKFTNCTLGDFALGMQSYLARPVVDETNLQGRYNFVLTWARDDASGVELNSAAGLFTAVQEQLGLRLEPKRASVHVMQIDRISSPIAN